MRRSHIITALVLVSTLWTTALVAAPTGYSPSLSAATYAAGALLCHQRPERSFHIGGSQLPVCARCLGLYAGAIAGVLVWAGLAGVRQTSLRVQGLPGSSRFRFFLLLLAAPTLATVATGAIGLWDPANVVRAVLAAPFGAAIAAVVTAAATGDLR